MSGTNIPSDYQSKEQVHISTFAFGNNLLGQGKKARQWARCEGRQLEWRKSPRGRKQDTLACARQDLSRDVRLFLTRTNRRAICARAEGSRVQKGRPILELRAAPPQTPAKKQCTSFLIQMPEVKLLIITTRSRNQLQLPHQQYCGFEIVHAMTFKRTKVTQNRGNSHKLLHLKNYHPGRVTKSYHPQRRCP